MKTSTLKNFAYFKTGGTAKEIIFPSSKEQLAQILKDLYKRKIDYFFLGKGSNSLIMDAHFNGVVIGFKGFNSIKVNNNIISVGAGVENTALAQVACEKGLDGLAWLHRLPGQLGATTRMNARCYGGEISKVTTRVDVVTKHGDIKHYSGEHVFRGYKDTIFMTNGDAITNVTFKTIPGDQNAIRQAMVGYEKDRISKRQFDFPTCGCVFKNHYEIGVPSGMLLEASGVRALSNKSLEINPLHANFVFNKGASSREILEFTLKMRQLVFEKYGVFLEYEMEFLGTLPLDLESLLKIKKQHKPNEKLLKVLRDDFASRLSHSHNNGP